MAPKVILVTVGTTKFDKLIEKITDPCILKELYSKGYGKLIIQIGKGNIEETKVLSSKSILFEAYSLKESLEEDIRKADLVISHAGAGSCLEILRAGKPLIVVINEDLMDNHQSELAEALSEGCYAHACTVSSLLETLQTLDKKRLKPYPPPDPNLLVRFLDNVMGIIH